MKLRNLLKFVFVISLVSPAAMAADASGTQDSGAAVAKLPINSPAREDIDNEITNAKLRAQTGAKSLFSFQSTFNYNGGSIEDPLGKTRPQLSPGTVENDPAKLTGSISGKYRITDHDNLNVGFGVGWLTPTYQGQKGQAEDPYAAYGRVFKAMGLQNVLNVAVTYYTTDSSIRRKDLFETDIDHTILWTIPTTKWQLGANVMWEREIYGRHATAGQEDTLALFPFAEYEFNNTLSFRTVYRGLTFFNTLDQQATFKRDDPTQSMGLGISVTRDIYLYPNVQWVWADLRSDKTNVALAANINL